MARPKASELQKQHAYFIWKRTSLTINGILDAMTPHYGGEIVSRATIGNWVKEFKNGRSEDELGEQFQWAGMFKRGFPESAGPFLLKVASLLSEYGDSQLGVFGRPTGFSYREALWCWRVYEALEHRITIGPEVQSQVDGLNALTWQMFVRYFKFLSFAEEANDLAHMNVSTVQVEQMLAYRPWESTDARSRHRKAIEAGVAQDPSAANNSMLLSELLFRFISRGEKHA